MFTGIIQHHGVIHSFERLADGARLSIRTTDPEPFRRGESLAVNGVCLTVLPADEGLLSMDLSNETLVKTTFGTWSSGTGGRTVNTERALALGDRLGGHLVQGHVDGVSTLLSITMEGMFAVYRWSCPPEFRDLMVDKGSIAVDGVSLTVIEPDAASFGAALIPETLTRTNLGASTVGDPVNLEFDMMAKYVRNLVSPYLPSRRKPD